MAASTLLVDQQMAIVRRWTTDFWNTADDATAEAIAKETLASGPGATFRLHGFQAGGGVVDSLDAALVYRARVRASFPDLRVTLNKTRPLGKERRFVSRYTVTGTHTGGGGLAGPATGKAFAIKGLCTHKFGKGGGTAQLRLVKEWNVSEDASMLQQLGLLPPQAVASLPGLAAPGAAAAGKAAGGATAQAQQPPQQPRQAAAGRTQ